jgi:hypothetical protein
MKRQRQPDARSQRCPVCQAGPGINCTSRVHGDMLAGMHFQRVVLGRSAAAVALSLYAPLFPDRRKRGLG